MKRCVQEQQAYLDGQVAALRHIAFTDNPHPLSCTHSRAWSRGHRLITDNAKAPA